MGITKDRHQGEELGRNKGILFSVKRLLENGISYE